MRQAPHGAAAGKPAAPTPAAGRRTAPPDHTTRWPFSSSAVPEPAARTSSAASTR